MAGVKGRSGGARTGAGRKPKAAYENNQMHALPFASEKNQMQEFHPEPSENNHMKTTRYVATGTFGEKNQMTDPAPTQAQLIEKLRAQLQAARDGVAAECITAYGCSGEQFRQLFNDFPGFFPQNLHECVDTLKRVESSFNEVLALPANSIPPKLLLAASKKLD